MTQVTRSGTVSNHHHPPPMIPPKASGREAALHSKLNGRNAVREEGGS
jgi:hypothetical protein